MLAQYALIMVITPPEVAWAITKFRIRTLANVAVHGKFESVTWNKKIDKPELNLGFRKLNLLRT